MEKTALKSKYEAMIVADAKLSNEEKEAIFKEATEAITKNGGQVINNQVWLERHRMTFRIKKCTEGSYYLINFEDDGSSLAKIRQALRLNEKILRFVLMNVE